MARVVDIGAGIAATVKVMEERHHALFQLSNALFFALKRECQGVGYCVAAFGNKGVSAEELFFGEFWARFFEFRVFGGQSLRQEGEVKS